MQKIGIGIIGFGYIGAIHGRAAMACDETELVGFVSRPESEKAEQIREQFPQAQLFASAKEMAASPDVHGVVIATPNSLHAPQADQFLRAGKAVLVEKPMATDLEEAEAMGNLATEKGLPLLVGHMWRFDREVLAVRQLVEEGDLGDIIKTKGYGIHENWGPSGWFTRRPLAGGGALIDMGVHAIDTVRFLLGDPKPVSVYATIGTHYGSYDVDDSSVLVITWDNGTTSLVESGWWHPHMDGPEASTQLFGTTGYARVFPTMAKFKPPRQPWLPRFATREEHCDGHIYLGQMQEFARAFLENRQPNPGLEEGLTVMRICEAAYRSAQTGQVVQL